MNSEKSNSTKFDSIFDKRFQDYLEENKNSNPRDLLLRKSPFSSEQTKFATSILLGRKIAAAKFPTLAKLPYFIYPNSDIMEQASSEITARYKAKLTQNSSIIDITLGGGFDAYFMAEGVKTFLGIDRDSDLVQLVNHNFNQLNLTNAVGLHSDSLRYLDENRSTLSNWVYADPQRRAFGKKLKGIENYSPKFSEIFTRIDFESTGLIVKLSPMDDHHELIRNYNNINQIHILSVENECKEMLIIVGKAVSVPTIHTYLRKSINNIEVDFLSVSDYDSKQDDIPYSNTQHYLYEFNPSILKAGTGHIEAAIMGISKLAPRTNFYTSEQLMNNFPGRVFKVQDLASYKSETVKAWFPNSRANVLVRNFSPGAEELQKKEKLIPSTENIYLIGTSDMKTDRLIIKAELIQ